MKLTAVVILCTLLITNLLLAQSKGDYKLNGAVVDSATGKGLPGANIAIISRKNNQMCSPLKLNLNFL